MLMRAFYMKLLMFVVLPFLLFCGAFGVWKIITKIQKSSNDMFISKSISTLVILLFFIHPNIVKYVFHAF